MHVLKEHLRKQKKLRPKTTYKHKKNSISKWILQFVVSGFLLSLALTTTAQIDRGKIAYNWVFGYNCSITFNTDDCEPVENELPTNYYYYGSTLTHSDKNGNLVFYGQQFLYNSQHELISDQYIEMIGIRQNIIQFPKPNSLDTFYIFAITMDRDRETSLKMTTLDMSANGGFGAFIEMNQLVAPEIEEAMTATRHANGKDIWLILHKIHSNRFCSYLITENGLDLNPVCTNIGSTSLGFNGEKYLKISPDGTILAYAPENGDDVNIMNFDNSTGQLSNCITLNLGDDVVGFSFH